MEISQAARSALYLELAKSEANEYQRDPVFIHGGDVDDWLADVEISKPQQAMLRKLLWRRGAALVFSDIPAVLSLAKNSEEVAAVFRTITRVRSLLVELKLPLKDGRATFIDYWSAGTLNAERAPFLVAITRRRAPQLIDITQFLPTLARRRVYTFPTAAMGLRDDCRTATGRRSTSSRRSRRTSTWTARRLRNTCWRITWPSIRPSSSAMSCASSTRVKGCTPACRSPMTSSSPRTAKASWLLGRSCL